MTSSIKAKDAERLARSAFVQAAWPPVLLVLFGVACAIFSPPANTARVAALLVSIISAVVTLIWSAVLAFDALLFRVIASHEDEGKGGAAVDDILTRMRLKTRPEAVRSLADRAAGTRRVMLRQRLAFAISAAALLFMLMAIPGQPT